MRSLRDYQEDLYLKAKEALKKYRSICIQSATGSGKTPLVSAMVESVYNKGKRAWFIVPRKELLIQASNHFRKWNVPHGIIAPNSQESRAFRVHVVSKQTIERRWDKIKNWPELILIDETHINLDFQLKLKENAPDGTVFLGMTATPERTDGRGLSSKAGGIYESLIEGPSIPWLTERHFLTELRYFSPPIDGLQNMHMRGTDYDEEELEELLERKKIYGELVGHYQKHGKGKPALIFCRSVKSAYQTAERFKEKGFNFHCIEGKLTDKKRKELISALTEGRINGLTNCDICTYGLDVPRVEYAASIRPTTSRALYMQIIGRILRPYENPQTGYKKTEALFFDHVNLILEHQDADYPGIPLHYIPQISWNFDGTEKRKRKKDENNIRLCPLNDYLYCAKQTCRGCEHNPDEQSPDPRKPMIVIPAQLEEIKKPIPLNERPPEERREIQDKIGSLIMEYKTSQAEKIVKELYDISKELGYKPLWIYHKLLTDENRYTINVPLLHIIAKIAGFKPGWCFFAMKKIKFEKQIKKEYQEIMVN